MRPADELVRVTRTPDGGLAQGRGLPGRGAWLCADSPACIDEADKRRGFARALKTPLQPEAVAALRADLHERARMVGRRDDGT